MKMNKNWLVIADNYGLEKKTSLLLNRENKCFDSESIFAKHVTLNDALDRPDIFFDFIHLKKINFLLLVNLSKKLIKSLDFLGQIETKSNAKIIFLTSTQVSFVGVEDNYYKTKNLVIFTKKIISSIGDISEKNKLFKSDDDEFDCSKGSKTILYDDLIKFVNLNKYKEGIIDTYDFIDKKECDVASFQMPWESSSNIPNRTFKSINQILHNQQNCGLDLIYRCNPNQVHLNISIASFRHSLGSDFSFEIDNTILQSIDYIVPVPETGKIYAQGIAKELNKPYLEAIFKKKKLGRSFDIQSVAERKKFIISKLGVIPDLIKDKSIGLVDEAIFTGSTLKVAVELFREFNTKIHILIPSPESINQCQSNMQPSRASLLEYVPRETLKSYFNVDSVTYNSHKLFKRSLISKKTKNICTFCFDKKDIYDE